MCKMASRPKVLIVEDDEAVRRLVTHLTRRTIPNALIATASDGREALAKIRANGADLVITDGQMPRMNGDELVRTIRAQHLDTPVIMVSGSPEAQPLGEAAGINRFVPKMQIGAELPGAIRSLLMAA